MSWQKGFEHVSISDIYQSSFSGEVQAITTHCTYLQKTRLDIR